MNQLQIIHEQRVLNKDFAVYGTFENPLFLAKDVAEWIDYNKDDRGYYDVNAMLRAVDEDEKEKFISPTNNRTSWFLTEDGLYEVLMQSRKPIAKQFKKQVKEILKSIRKHGAYMTPETIDNIISDPDFGIKLLTTLKEEKEKRIQAERVAYQANLTLEQQRPKVVYAEAVEVSEDTVLVKDLAAILTQKGISIGEKRLFVWLRENGYLCKQKGEMWNMPTQRSLDLGVIVVKHGLRTGSSGEMRKTRTSKITGKGQIYFINKFLKEQSKGA